MIILLKLCQIATSQISKLRVKTTNQLLTIQVDNLLLSLSLQLNDVSDSNKVEVEIKVNKVQVEINRKVEI